MTDYPPNEIPPGALDAGTDLVAIDWEGFIPILTAAGMMCDDEEYYLDNPWKWTPEYACWLAAGRPEPPTGGITELNWQRFVRAAREAGGYL